MTMGFVAVTDGWTDGQTKSGGFHTKLAINSESVENVPKSISGPFGSISTCVIRIFAKQNTEKIEERKKKNVPHASGPCELHSGSQRDQRN